jgi:hypothetical protein
MRRHRLLGRHGMNVQPQPRTTKKLEKLRVMSLSIAHPPACSYRGQEFVEIHVRINPLRADLFPPTVGSS